MVTQPVILGILFSISITLQFKLVFSTSSQVLGIFSLTSSKFFSRTYLSELHCVLETNPLVLDTLKSIAFTFVTNLSHVVLLLSLLKSSGTFFSFSIFYLPHVLN